jgi:hypothetical protein
MPGPCAGLMVYTDDAEAGVWVPVRGQMLVARKKLCKMKRLLAKLDVVLKESEWVDHKVLERIR